MNTEDMRFMKVNEVAEIMGISNSFAYELMQSGDCPFKVLRIHRRYVVPYNSFCKWYDSLAEDAKSAVKI